VTRWQLGLGWYRLGLADRLLDQAVSYLRGRSANGTNLIDLPLVRASLADAASGTAEAGALLGCDVTAASLRQAHRTLNEVGRGCLNLFGAAGFLADGPGSEVRASELLADTYAPSAEREYP
jgi:alkylation response protein AidB-like acyl-CoA dehydrogenase